MNDAQLLAQIREAVPRGAELDDGYTHDAYLVARIHWLLWGEPPPGWTGADLSQPVDPG